MGRGVCLGVAHPGEAVVLLKPADLKLRGCGAFHDHAQSPGCLCHQRVGLAIRRYIRGLKLSLTRALIQLHEVVADEAHKLRVRSVGKGVFDGQGVLRGRHVPADAAQLTPLHFILQVDDLHALDGQPLLRPPGLKGEPGLLIHALAERIPRGGVAPVGVGHRLAHMWPVHRQKEHQPAVLHLHGVEL